MRVTGELFDHLLECDGCENHLEQSRRTIKTLGSIGDEEDEEFDHV